MDTGITFGINNIEKVIIIELKKLNIIIDKNQTTNSELYLSVWFIEIAVDHGDQTERPDPPYQ